MKKMNLVDFSLTFSPHHHSLINVMRKNCASLCKQNGRGGKKLRSKNSIKAKDSINNN